MKCVKIQWKRENKKGTRQYSEVAYFIDLEHAKRFEVNLINDPHVLEKPVLTEDVELGK